MSALYSLTLRTNHTTSRIRNRKLASRFLFFFLIASISFNGVFAQEVSKEEQNRKEAEQKRQDAILIDAKLKANPRLKERRETSRGELKLTPTQLSPEEQQKASDKLLADEKVRVKAKLSQEKVVMQNGGVEYKVITNGNKVEYVVTNAGNVIYRQQVNSSASLYDKQVQAEKEALYASNMLRRNLNYPLDALKSEINSLINAPKINTTNNRSNNNRITADYTFNGGAGTINAAGAATPYPATITVSGVPAGATVKSITINGLDHTYSSDVDILLQSPTGVNVFLMSDVGGSGAFVNDNYTFEDGAATAMGATHPASGSYKPTNLVGTLGAEPDDFVAPGPGAVSQANPALSLFGSGNQNGTWNLFVLDDFSGDGGNWDTWSIVFTDPIAVCFPITITGQPGNATICAGANGSFTVAATPAGVSYNWQVNTGSGFTYLTNGGVYSGVNTATLNITGATLAMNSYQYRVVATCSQGGLPEISNPATLTVNVSPSPPIITPPSGAICPGGNVALNASQATASTTVSSGTIAVPIADGVVNTSTLNVAGFSGSISAISVTLNITHTWDADVRVNLIAPNGQILNLVNARGSSNDNFVNTIISSTSSTSLATGAAPFTGTFAADATNAVGIAPYLSNTTAFANLYSVANGNWTLAVSDHGIGDVGTLDSWSITLTPSAAVNAVWSPIAGLFNDAGLTIPYVAGTYQTTVYASPATTTTYSASVTNGTCPSPAATATVTVNAAPSITGQPAATTTACAGGSKTISVTATGTALVYQWQVDPNTGTFSNITASANNPSGFIYTGFNSATLTISDVMATMNNYKYRCVVSGSCTPPATSNATTLTVSQVPAISVTKSTQCAPIGLTASGADTYTWSPSAGLSATTGATVTANPTANTIYTVTGTVAATGCSNSTQVDVKFTPPVPTVAPAAPIICVGSVQQLSITSSSLPPAANTTSSGAVNLPFADGPPLTVAISNISVAGVSGTVQSISVNLNIAHTYDGDVTINLKAPNGNIYNLAWEVGGSGDNFTNTTFSSLGGTPIFNGTAPFTGTFAADAFTGVGIAPNLSNVATWNDLFSVPNGTWSLICSDPYDFDDGTLLSWSITINYATPDAGIWTPVTGLFTNSAGTTPYVAGTPAATVYASPAATTTYSVSVTNTSTETRVFSSGGSVTIAGVAPGSTAAGAGAPYPSTLTVAGLPANAVIKSVTIKGVKHSFPDDIDMLLQSPTGTNVVLMSDVGGSTPVTGQNYTFDDAGGLMADAALNGTGTYHPTNIGASDTYPAPVGAISQGTPALSSFTGDPNGTWNLYIRDQFAGDVGSISSWEITFTIPTATNCTSAPRTINVTVNSPITFANQLSNRTVCQGDNLSLVLSLLGTIQSIQWQVSTNGGTTWTDIGGATTTTLNLTNILLSQNGYRYRLSVSNGGCGAVFSNAATLTVNPLPTVSLSLSSSGQTQLRPGLVTTLTANSSPAGASYQWFLNGVAQPSITGSSYVVDAYHLGTYTVKVTDVNGCSRTTSGVTFTALPSSQLFVYPNPTSGAYYVTLFMPQVNTPVTITVIDMKGSRLVERHETTTAPYTRFDFSNEKLAAGVYIIEFRNSGGQRLGSGRLVVTR